MSVIMPLDEEKAEALRNSIDERREAVKPTGTTTIAVDAAAATDSHSDSSDSDDDKDKDDDKDEDEVRLDPKEMLIVKDGTIKVAHPYQEPEPQYDANGELIKASGTWTQVEHERFLKALQTYPKGPWKAIAAMVGSRTVRQTQTHAQKYREKMARRLRGLRNRNGTLQTPPMRLSQLVATQPMYGQLVMPAMQYTHRPQSLGGVEYLPMPPTYVTSSPNHAMVETPHGMRPAIPTDIYYSPTHAYHHQMHHQQMPPHHVQHSHVASPPNAEYGMYKHQQHHQQHHSPMPPKTPTTPSADLQPTPWTENAPKVLLPTPDYAESMDFLMNVYYDPNQAAQAQMLQAQQQHYAATHASNRAASPTS